MNFKNSNECNQLAKQVTSSLGRSVPNFTNKSTVSLCESCVLCSLPVDLCTNESHFPYHYYDEIFDMRPQGWISDIIDSFNRSLLFMGGSGNPDPDLLEVNYLTALFEDLMIYMAQVSRARSMVDVILALTSYARSRYGPNQSLFQLFVKNFQFLWDDSDTPNLQSTGDTFPAWINQIRDTILNYQKLKTSPTFNKLYKLIIYCLSFNLFTSAGLTFELFNYKVCEQEALRLTHSSKLGFIEQCADTFSFLAQKGYQIYKTGSIDPIFHTGERYAEWFDDATWLKDNIGKLDDCESFGFTFSSYYEKLTSSIEKGESIEKHAIDISAWDKKIVHSLLATLKTLLSEIDTSANARKSRLTPFSLVIYGGTGIGKSSLIELLFSYYGKLRNLPVEEKFKFTRNPNANFWDGYSPSQWCCLLDDIGFRDPKSASVGDPTVLEFLQIINQVPFCPDQADLARKGRTPFKSEFVMATTNVKDLNVYHYYSVPSAAQRRFPYVVTPKVKECYLTNGMLDSNKVPGNVGLPDFWTFTVERVIPANIDEAKKKATYEVIHQDCDLGTFLFFFSTIVDNHWINQRKVADSVELIRGLELCECCRLPTEKCRNLHPQAFQEVILSFSLLSIWLALCVVFNYLSPIFTILRNWYTLKQKLKKLRNRICNPFSFYTMDRAYWVGLGNRVQDKFCTPKFLIRVALVASSTYLITKLISMFQNYECFQPQKSESDESFKAPEPRGKERNNVWYSEQYDMRPTYISDSSNALFGKVETLEQKVRNNVIFCTIVTETKRLKCRMLCLKDNLYVTNNHCLPEEGCVLTITQSNFKTGVNRNLRVILSGYEIYRDVAHDLAIVKLSCLPQRKSIVKYLLPEMYSTMMKGQYIGLDEDGNPMTNQVTAIKDGGRVNMGDVTCYVWLGKSEIRTEDGFCGTPLVVETPRGPAIAGIHSIGSGRTNTVGSSKMPLEYMEHIIKQFDAIDVAPVTISAQSVKREIGPLHPKSPFRYIEKGTANIIGSFEGFRPKPKSAVSKTLLHNQLLKEGYTEKYTKPIMGGWIPWRLAAIDLTNPVQKMDNSLIEEITECYIKDILNALSLEELETVHKYDVFTAVNGAPGVAYVDSINRNTSIGLPYRKPKTDFLTYLPPTDGVQEPVEFNEEITDRISQLLVKYNTAQRAYPIFNACLKDEPVTFKKREMGKTRVFSSAPVDFSIVSRMYLLSFVRLVQNNKLIFESCPGTVCQSKEWGELYNFLTQDGKERMVAGDFKAFDKRMCAPIIEAAFNVIIAVLKASGNYTAQDITAVRCISADVRFPLTDFNGDLVEFYGSNPSGWPLTVILNGLVNSLYMRYVYASAHLDGRADDFRKHVHLLTYGDDNIMGVSEDCTWFDHTVIQNVLKEVDIVYTMADKEQESIPFIHIDECSFLKRKWRFDEKVGDFLCPLDLESIEKMLMTWTRSKTVIPETQMCAILDSALQEYFFHGYDSFHKARDLFERLVEENKLTEYLVRPLPLYEELVERWNEASSQI